MNTKLLKKVKQAILGRPRQFEMEYYFGGSLYIGRKKALPSHCGTAACIAGWAAHLSFGQKTLEQSRFVAQMDPRHMSHIGRDLLEINNEQGDRLFHLAHWPDNFKEQYRRAKSALSRARLSARRIDHFIATNGAE